jgi:ubiquitin-like 1-activating enzyme E1 A
VTVETVSDVSALEGDAFDAMVQAVDLVCVTDWDRDGLVSVYSLSLLAF